MARKGERGTTLIEVMLAGVILLVALLGFAGMASTSAASTGVAHRRGSAAYAQIGLIDRYLVSARNFAGLAQNTWVIDSCYDITGQVLKANTGFASTYTCDPGTYYRTWVNVAGAGPWALSVYAERIDPGCAAADRYSSLACVAADLYLSN